MWRVVVSYDFKSILRTSRGSLEAKVRGHRYRYTEKDTDTATRYWDTPTATTRSFIKMQLKLQFRGSVTPCLSAYRSLSSALFCLSLFFFLLLFKRHHPHILHAISALSLPRNEHYLKLKDERRVELLIWFPFFRFSFSRIPRVSKFLDNI